MYFVPDLERARTFYEGALGLTPVWRDAERLMIGYKLGQGTSGVAIHADLNLPIFH